MANPEFKNAFGTNNYAKALPSKKRQTLSELNLENDECVVIFDHVLGIKLIYKKVKPKKHVAVMSMLHSLVTYVEEHKTKAHMFYNASKGGVDVFDMMCTASDTGRKTEHWTLCSLYGSQNIIMNNSFTICNQTAKANGCKTKKCDFFTGYSLQSL